MSISEHIRTEDLMVIAELSEKIGHNRVQSDHETRQFYANDIFWQPGIAPLAVIMPTSEEELSAAIRIATQAGIAVVPRGGGMSYTKGYLPERSDSIVIDARNMNRILEVNTADLYITVQAGATWEQVNEALEGTGLRTGYWGPLSGTRATVGGALSQNSAFFGSALNGTVAESVLGVTVVLADGRIVTTGSGARKGTKPFTRYGGPDLTGIFLGDNGAMGVKAAATLRLWPRPAEVDYLTFGFETLKDMALAQTAMARTRMVSEGFGIDRTKAQHSASVNRLSDNLKTLGSLATAGKSLLAGVKSAVDVATAGTAFLMKHPYSLHIVTEARNASEVALNVSTLKEIGERTGKSLANSVPKVMRSKPFSPVRGMLGLNGERWVPIHAVFPLGDAARVVDANEAYFADRAADMAEHGIIYTVMTMTVGNEFFIEPAFYWMDEITQLHERSVGAEVVKPWRDRPANVAAREAVIKLRRGTQDLYTSLGGVSWQVARDYPFREVLDDNTWSLLTDIKKAVDPQSLMNPGSLGLRR
jgi:FAD/FMN-containing dehydrogenase